MDRFSINVYMNIYIYIYTCIIKNEPGHGTPTATPPKWYSPPSFPPQTSHLHPICSIWEAQPPISMFFSAFASHNHLVTGPCLAIYF